MVGKWLESLELDEGNEIMLINLGRQLKKLNFFISNSIDCLTVDNE